MSPSACWPRSASQLGGGRCSTLHVGLAYAGDAPHTTATGRTCELAADLALGGGPYGVFLPDEAQGGLQAMLAAVLPPGAALTQLLLRDGAQVPFYYGAAAEAAWQPTPALGELRALRLEGVHNLAVLRHVAAQAPHLTSLSTAPGPAGNQHYWRDWLTELPPSVAALCRLRELSLTDVCLDDMPAGRYLEGGRRRELEGLEGQGRQECRAGPSKAEECRAGQGGQRRPCHRPQRDRRYATPSRRRLQRWRRSSFRTCGACLQRWPPARCAA